jgi:iron complex outermembrane receptor protein
MSGPVWAQNTTEGGAEPQLEEVMVTAQRRAEDLQEASIAVTAISGEAMLALGVTSAMDLTQVVPNLTVSQYGNGANVAIRGVVSLNQSEVGNPAVAYNLDGVYLARQRAALSGIYDLDRVEVLRGPQGTLYGRNATAGSINVITTKPDLAEASASGSIGFGNYNAFQATGAFNMPLSDTVGFRGAFNVDRHDGYVDNFPNNRKFDDMDLQAGRVHLLWKPSDDFSALFTIDVAEYGGAGRGGNSTGAPLGLYATSVGATPYRYAAMIGPTSFDQSVESETLTLNWSLPLVDVTYVGNHRTDDYLAKVSQAIYGPLSSYCRDQNSLNCFHPLTNSSQDTQISHELRFSQETDRLKWVLGLYYFDESNDFDQTYEPDTVGNGTLGRWVHRPNVFEGSHAAFSQATWSLTDRLRLTGGVRYTEDRKKRDGFTERGPVGSIIGLDCVVGCVVIATDHADVTWTKTTWRAGVDFDLSPDSLLFAAVATGYKAGGFGSGEAPNNFPYGPENLTNYELGWKNQFLDRTLQLNVDAFFTKYEDYQATAGTVTATGTNVLFTVNAGTAEIKGVELESIYLLTPHDRLTFNATYLDAKFTSFFLPKGDGFSPGASFQPYDLTGKDLPYAPHATARLGYQHTFDLPAGGALIAQVDSGYTAHQYMDYHNFAVIAQDAYTRTSVSLTWERSEMFSAQLYARNLENKAILAGAQADTLAPGRNFDAFGKEAYYMPPRTYGIRLSAKF